MGTISYHGGSFGTEFTPIVLRFRGFGSASAAEGASLPAGTFELKAAAGDKTANYAKFKAFTYSPKQFYLVTTDADTAPRIFVPMHKNLQSNTLKGKIGLVEDGEGHVSVQVNGGNPEDGELTCEIRAEFKGALSPQRLQMEHGAMSLEQLLAGFNFITVGDTDTRRIYNAFVQTGGVISLGDYFDDKGYDLDNHTIYIEEDASPVKGASYLIRGLNQALANEAVVKAWADSSEEEIIGALANRKAVWEYTLSEIQPIVALYEVGISFVLTGVGGVGARVLDATFTFYDLTNGNPIAALPAMVGSATAKIGDGKLILQTIAASGGGEVLRRVVVDGVEKLKKYNNFRKFKQLGVAGQAAAEEVARIRSNVLSDLRTELSGYIAVGNTAKEAAMRLELEEVFDKNIIPNCGYKRGRLYEFSDGVFWDSQGALQLLGNMGPKPGKNYVAHHWFPVEHERNFMRCGVDISDAGNWVLASEHRLMHSSKHPHGIYNDHWTLFFDRIKNPTPDQINQELFRLKQMYPFTVPQ